MLYGIHFSSPSRGNKFGYKQYRQTCWVYGNIQFESQDLLYLIPLIMPRLILEQMFHMNFFQPYIYSMSQNNL